MATKRATVFTVVRVLSKLGYCSRKQAVELVLGGAVTVNGRATRDPGLVVSFRDLIAVRGQPVTAAKRRYLVLHKPRGYVTTRRDERDRPTVYDLLDPEGAWLAPVGRLDRDSEGVLLFTNDTRYSAWLTDPSNRVPKVYVVTIDRTLSPGDLEAVRHGVDIGRGEVARPTRLRVLGEARTYEITLTEGRNREVRRIFAALYREVIGLCRTRFGPYGLGGLEPGAWRSVEPVYAVPR